VPPFPEKMYDSRHTECAYYNEAMPELAKTPPPPYYAVIFTSIRTADDSAGYETMAERMVELAHNQPGFLGIESARSADGLGITVSYWTSEEAIHGWREHAEHLVAQQLGRQHWYESYELRIARVERHYGFSGQTSVTHESR
jgi:heme-degrading monooxygenase HmoA